MTVVDVSQLDIQELILKRNIVTWFQPIVSIRRKCVIGFEALSRGLCPQTGKIIPPSALFTLASHQHVTSKLDHLCREKAIETFAKLEGRPKDLLLFLNVDVGMMDDSSGCKQLMEYVAALGVSPCDVVIEIIEEKIEQGERLQEFIKTCRQWGFLIALDDVGNGHSNLDRIMVVRPDIIKLDRWLISGVQQDYYKQEVFKSLVGLARKIGALVIAEGIETLEEAICSLELGADMLQGYYFAKPKQYEAYTSGIDKVQRTAIDFRQDKNNRLRQEKNRQRKYNAILDTIVSELITNQTEYFESTLQFCAQRYHEVEYLYILNMEGVQITDSICSKTTLPRHSNKMFHPADRGTDQSLKDYFLFIQAGAERYTSEAYISLASGNLCVTSSGIFRDSTGKQYILCTDFVVYEETNHIQSFIKAM